MTQDLVFDVGLHKGEDTDFYLKKGYRVIAFEADPDLIDFCKNRFVHEITQGRLIIIEGAIGPEAAQLKLTFYKSARSIWGSINSQWNERNRNWGIDCTVIEVNRVDFSECLNTYGVPFYCKIDIEGADHHVLSSLTKNNDRPQYISIEAEKINFGELETQISSLYDMGYRRFRAVQQSWVRNSEITTRDLRGNEFWHRFEENSSGPFADDLRQEWVSKDVILLEFAKIYKYYRMLGDNAFVHRIMPMSRHAIYAASKVVGRPLVGWHDIHATLF